MFRQVRYQTGELDDVVKDMKNGLIPCIDVYDTDELEWVFGQLEEKGLYRVTGLPYDKNARDRVNEPEFEFRVPFCIKPISKEEVNSKELMYMDVYFEPDFEDTYDPVGEM